MQHKTNVAYTDRHVDTEHPTSEPQQINRIDCFQRIELIFHIEYKGKLRGKLNLKSAITTTCVNCDRLQPLIKSRSSPSPLNCPTVTARQQLNCPSITLKRSTSNKFSVVSSVATTGEQLLYVFRAIASLFLFTNEIQFAR